MTFNTPVPQNMIVLRSADGVNFQPYQVRRHLSLLPLLLTHFSFFL